MPPPAVLLTTEVILEFGPLVTFTTVVCVPTCDPHPPDAETVYVVVTAGLTFSVGPVDPPGVQVYVFPAAPVAVKFATWLPQIVAEFTEIGFGIGAQLTPAVPKKFKGTLVAAAL